MWNTANHPNNFSRVKHIPRKRFGQNFLTDQGIIESIVDAIDPKPGQPLIEIGP